MSSFRWYDKADIVAFSRHKGRLKAVMAMVWGIIGFFISAARSCSATTAFHVGNHADMLKHFTLFLVLEYFNRKDKPYWYIDTHSGAGLYDLSGDEAQKSANTNKALRSWNKLTSCLSNWPNL